MRDQRRGLQQRGRDDFLVGGFAERMAHEVDERAVAGVMQAVTIGANTVDAGDEAQVLDRV